MTKLEIVSPLPPDSSGIADYTAIIAAALYRLGVDVVCLVENERHLNSDFPFAVDLLKNSKYKQSDHTLRLYQIGNNPSHEFVYREAMLNPGLIDLHDGTLHHLIESMTLSKGLKRSYESILEQEYGPPGAKLAQLREAGIYSHNQFVLFPLHEHVLRASKGVIVHSGYLRSRIKVPPSVPVAVIPHFAHAKPPSWSNLDKKSYRKQLDIPDDAFLILSQGYITAPKRVDIVLRALKQLRQNGIKYFYVIGGERNSGYDVDADIADLGLDDVVRVTGYLNDDDFHLHLAASDVLVALRYPTVGESSGVLARALSWGVPAIAYDFGPTAELPSNVICKVPLELGVPHNLIRQLEFLSLEPLYLEVLSSQAKEYAHNHLSVELIGRRYLDIVTNTKS